MEDQPVEGNEKEAVVKGQGEETTIRRTQSSLELLSDTAMAAMGANQNNEEHEEAPSDGSADTSASARVTPSLSQSTSQASMGIGASANNVGATVGVSGEEGGVASTTVTQQQQDSESKRTARRVIPTSPYRNNTNIAPAPSVTTANTYAELPGLPIEHYASRSAAFAVPTPQRMYLPETYMPQPPETYMHQPPHFFHMGAAAATTGVPLMARPPENSAQSFAASRPNPATHAAFVPPRSSVAARAVGAEAAAPAGYPAYATQQPRLAPAPGATTHHYMMNHQHAQPPPQQEQPQNPHQSRVAPPVNPCESFQSDSTASLTSESKFLLAPKSLAAPSGSHTQTAETPVINNPGTKGRGTDLTEANQKLRQENIELKHELEKRDKEIMVLRGEVRELDLKVKELRQFPAGKISQIPMADMLEIMQIYGSEVSDTVMPPRKLNIQKASVIRQFRRWNPNFLKFFFFKDGKWEPKLGREGELARRQQTRKKGQKQSSSTTTTAELPPMAHVQQQLHPSSPMLRASVSQSSTPDNKVLLRPKPSPGSNRKRKAAPTGDETNTKR